MDSHSSGKRNGRPQKDYVPLYTRIKRLRRSAELSMLFWKVTPCIFLLGVVILVMDSSGSQYVVWVAYFVMIIGFPLIMGFWIAMTAAQNVYLSTSSYLYQTNLPILFADEQLIMQFQQPEKMSIVSKWQKIIQPRNVLHQLVLGSAHKSLLHEFLVGNANPSGKLMVDSNCLWISGTWTGQGLLIAATVLATLSMGCSGFPGACLLPVWGYFMFTIFCRQAALMAVCDYFLGTPQVKMHKLNNVGRYFVASAATQGNPEELGMLPPQ